MTAWQPKVVWTYKQYRIVDLLGPQGPSDYDYAFLGPRYTLEQSEHDSVGATQWKQVILTASMQAALIMELVGERPKPKVIIERPAKDAI